MVIHLSSKSAHKRGDVSIITCIVHTGFAFAFLKKVSDSASAAIEAAYLEQRIKERAKDRSTGEQRRKRRKKSNSDRSAWYACGYSAAFKAY